MQALGRDLAGELTNGGVIGLDGELGAGKTELVKGLASGVGHGGPVTSPTFTLLHEYRMGVRALYGLEDSTDTEPVREEGGSGDA